LDRFVADPFVPLIRYVAAVALAQLPGVVTLVLAVKTTPAIVIVPPEFGVLAKVPVAVDVVELVFGVIVSVFPPFVIWMLPEAAVAEVNVPLLDAAVPGLGLKVAEPIDTLPVV